MSNKIEFKNGSIIELVENNDNVRSERGNKQLENGLPKALRTIPMPEVKPPRASNDNCICRNNKQITYIKIYKNNETNKWILYIEGDYDYESDYQRYEDVEIEYCPFCGRKLN